MTKRRNPKMKKLVRNELEKMERDQIDIKMNVWPLEEGGFIVEAIFRKEKLVINSPVMGNMDAVSQYIANFNPEFHLSMAKQNGYRPVQ